MVGYSARAVTAALSVPDCMIPKISMIAAWDMGNEICTHCGSYGQNSIEFLNSVLKYR